VEALEADLDGFLSFYNKQGPITAIGRRGAPCFTPSEHQRAMEAPQAA
jgi:hypothetical protein